MNQGGHGHHHLHVRKRIHQKHQKYPHPNKKIKLLDDIIYVAAIIVPILTASQVVKIYLEQNASGVSILAWTTYLCSSLLWLCYGIVHKEKPIIFNSAICALINLGVVIGVIIYS